MKSYLLTAWLVGWVILVLGAACGAWPAATSVPPRLASLHQPLAAGLVAGLCARSVLAVWNIGRWLQSIPTEFVTSNGCVISGLPQGLAIPTPFNHQSARPVDQREAS